jgi:hypothetical protein
VRSLSLTLLLTALPLAPLTAQQASAPLEPAKVKAIHQLLDVSHMASLMSGAIAASVQSQRVANPQVPGEIWDLMGKKIGEMIPQLVDSLVPIYGRHFSQQEIESLVQFYSTPLGQRLLLEQPAIMTEAGEAGQRWGAQIGQQIVDSLAHAAP